MIFALIDYLKYRSRRGRYGESAGASALSLGFVDSLPDDLIAQLRVGDIILTQRFDSILSWGTMYFASAFVDHAAGYIGDGKVRHMTLGGIRTHHINTIAKGSRVLPARLNAPLGDEHFIDKSDDEVVDYQGLTLDGGFIKTGWRLSHILPPKFQLAWVGMRLLSGFYITRYRWEFTADLLILALLVDAPIFVIFRLIFATPFAAAIVALTVFNIIRLEWRRSSGLGYELISHPDIFLENLHKYGGIIFTKIGPLSLSKLGIMPLKLFLAIEESLRVSGEGTDDGSDD